MAAPDDTALIASLRPWPRRVLDRLRSHPWPTFWLTRFVILRLLGVVYLAAFVGTARQIVPLIGSHGITPVGPYLDAVATHFGSRTAAFQALPSVFWCGCSDRMLLAMAWLGVGLSALLVAGFANALSMTVLWGLYLSFVHVGQIWYGYGWEIQLCETGFLAIFLCPLLDPRPFPRSVPPTAIVWLHRWLAFRIFLGAGLIKLRHDPCWRDLTCLDYHFETQPIPNPLSRWFHLLPHGVHAGGVAFNHACELVLPFLVFGPRPVRHLAGALLLVFQCTLIASGNLAFLNWLTIVPVLACFDDTLLTRVLPRALGGRAQRAMAAALPSRAQTVVAVVVTVLLLALSVEPVQNLLSPQQRMNGSFNALALVNTYGAFGSVGRDRHELIVEGTLDQDPQTAHWRTYEFKCKPGDVRRRPCVLGPYHLRLDWQIWFAAMGSPRQYPWTLRFVRKLLEGDPGTLSLLAGNPFPDGPPRYVRVSRYRYRLAPANASAVWERSYEGPWLPPLTLDDLGGRDEGP